MARRLSFVLSTRSTLVPLLVIAIFFVAIAFFGAMPAPHVLMNAGLTNQDITHVARESEFSNSDDRKPISLRRIEKSLLDINQEDRDHLLSLVQPSSQNTGGLSYFLHVLRLHGMNTRFDHAEFSSSNKIFRLIVDDEYSKSFFGSPSIVRTRHGASFMGGGVNPGRKRLAGEYHRDQCLGVLAEIGIPLSQHLAIGGESYQLRDVLRDSIANFHLNQNELQWTAMAYGLYLPPQKEWINKYGEKTDFDTLAATLLDSPLEKSCCAGTHLVYSLTILYRVDKEHFPILSKDISSRLRSRIREFADTAVSAQEASGSWSLNWHRDLLDVKRREDIYPNIDVPGSRLLATSHLSEWLLYLPEEFNVPHECLRRAGLWLHSRLKEMNNETALKFFCPCTHAVAVVRAL